MAINEKIQTGRKFRKLIDEDSRLWLRISFWTKACDVEFDDGQTAETKFANIIKTMNDLKTSFQDGVNKIYNKLKGLGFTPETNSPDDICGAIQNVHSSRYTDGYNSGRLQGREDVKANPETYGVSTASKLAQLVTPGFQMNHNIASYTCPKTGTYHIKVQYINMNNGNHNACYTLVRLTVPGNIYTFVHRRYDYGGTNSFIDDNVNASNGQIITVNANAGDVFRLEVGGNEISAGYDGDPQLMLFYAAAMWEIY